MSLPQPLVALVTAGSAGLGAATAKLFAANGMRVVVNYAHDTARAEAFLEELTYVSSGSALEPQEGRTDFKIIKADVSKREEARSLVAETVAALGRLDVIFSNQGWTEVRGWESLEDNVVEEDWNMCFDVNVKSHLWLMHAAKEHLERTEGCFVVTSSLAGIRTGGSSLAYSVTKAALNHLVRGLAVLAAPKDWGMRFSKEIQDQNIERSKLKRVVTVEECAEQVLCFVKSKGVTGVNAVLDAGWSL